MPTFNSFEMKQSFWKSVKYLLRYRIFEGTVYRLKVENFKSCRWANLSPCHCKSKILGHLKFSAQMPTFKTFEMKQSFWKPVKYLWRYRIFAVTVYRLKVGNFKSCRWAKFSRWHAKEKYLRTWNFQPKCPLWRLLRWNKVFENRVNTFGDIGFLPGQFTGWKWIISNLVDGLSFHLAIAKVKYPGTWNFRPKCPLSKRWRWSKDFENRLNTFGDIAYLLVRFTGWKWKISNIVDGRSFHAAIAKVKYLGIWTFQPKFPLSTRLRWSKVFTGWNWKISNLVDGLSFHLAIAKVKYLGTWNFRPESALSRLLRWSKVFENRVNTFGDIGFLPGQFTGWKWKISNLVDGLSIHLAIAKLKYLGTWNFWLKCPLSKRWRWSNVFENRLNTFGDIGFLLGQFTGSKWEISNLFDGLSFHLAIAKAKFLRTWTFRAKCPLSTRLRWSKVFENLLNTFGDIGYLLVRFTGWKWKISNLVDGLSFHLAIAKVKYLGTWNFRPKCPLSRLLRWSKVFESRVNTFGDIGFLPGKFTGWKWKISNLVDVLSFHLAIAKVKYPGPSNFRPKCPLSKRWSWSKVFENWLNAFGDIGYLLVRFTGGKWKISNLVDELRFHAAIAKVKYLGIWTFQPKFPLSTRLRWSKVFENLLNTFGDIGYLLVRLTGWNWKISNLVDGLSFHLAIAKVKYLGTWNFRPESPLSRLLRWSKVFENRVNTFGEIGFLPGQFTGWKWKISNLVDGLSIHLAIAKLKYLGTWNFWLKFPLSKRWRWSKVFENRLNTFGDIGYLLVRFTVWKWKISNLVDGLSFHLAIAKVKYPGTWNFPPKCPLSKRWRWSKVFENRLNTFGDIAYLLVRFTGWKWKISNLVDGLNFHAAIAKVKYLGIWTFQPKFPLSTRLRWSKVFENLLNTFGDIGYLLVRFTVWKWKISNLVDGLSFHLAIANVKYPGTWNFPPKCPLSKRWRWSKVFENRLNTFGDIAYLLVRFTGWKWKISNLVDGLNFHAAIAKVKYLGIWTFSAQIPTFNTFEMKQSFWKSVKYLWRYRIFAGTAYRLKLENFKSCRWAKFSPCHCKSKIPGHLKFSARIPTFKAFEMKQIFWKSGKYLWRYRIFAGTVYRLKVENFKSCRWAKYSPCHCKIKIPGTWNFWLKCPLSKRWRWSKVFENRLSTFGDIGFLLGQFTGWKWEISNLQSGTVYRLKVGNFKSRRWAKFSPCLCKTKIPAHVKFSPQLLTFNTYEMKQSFWISVKYLWRYGIFPETVYRLKVRNFKSCRRGKFSPCHCGSKIPAHLKFPPQISNFNTFEMKQSFWKSVKYLWRYGIFAGTVYMLNVENFKSCRWAKFSTCHCKSKIPAHLKFSA